MKKKPNNILLGERSQIHKCIFDMYYSIYMQIKNRQNESGDRGYPLVVAGVVLSGRLYTGNFCGAEL